MWLNFLSSFLLQVQMPFISNEDRLLFNAIFFPISDEVIKYQIQFKKRCITTYEKSKNIRNDGYLIKEIFYSSDRQTKLIEYGFDNKNHLSDLKIYYNKKETSYLLNWNTDTVFVETYINGEPFRKIEIVNYNTESVLVNFKNMGSGYSFLFDGNRLLKICQYSLDSCYSIIEYNSIGQIRSVDNRIKFFYTDQQKIKSLRYNTTLFDGKTKSDLDCSIIVDLSYSDTVLTDLKYYYNGCNQGLGFYMKFSHCDSNRTKYIIYSLSRRKETEEGMIEYSGDLSTILINYFFGW